MIKETKTKNGTPLAKLALNGGPKVRNTPFPNRKLLGLKEKTAVDALFDQAIISGEAFGYDGPEEEAYCQEFARFMGGGYADAVNSGTTAIYVSLRSLGIEPFTEVIVSPITDPGGMMPIVLNNCIPVIADAEPGSYNAGPKQIEKLISPLTSAILVAHIGGEPADIQGIIRIAQKYHIPVVEDCAQAAGAKVSGKYAGTFGDLSAFSTMFSKLYCTGGQGGMVYTRSEKLYREARRNSDRGKPFGLPEGSTNCLASLNFNLGDLGSAIGRVQLKKLPLIVKRRQEIVAQIGQGLKALNVKAVSIPSGISGSEPSYWFLRLRFHSSRINCSKETFCQALIAEGIPGVGSDYYHLPHTLDWYQHRRVFGKSGYPWSSPLYKGNPEQQFPCPNALAAVKSHFYLLISESWGEKEITDTVAALHKVASAFLK